MAVDLGGRVSCGRFVGVVEASKSGSQRMPLVFGLHNLSQMVSVHVESDAWIELALDPDAVD